MCVGKTEALPKKAVGIVEASEKGVGSMATIKFSEFQNPKILRKISRSGNTD